jgi:Ribonuclease G/E
MSAARAAFGPDNPGVAMGAISRFGLLELSVPRRTRPCLDLLTDESGAPTPLTLALKLLRNLEREALADGGGRFVGLAREDVILAARPALGALTDRLGARITLQTKAADAKAELEVSRL